jgi:hypothetical protein
MIKKKKEKESGSLVQAVLLLHRILAEVTSDNQAVRRD